MSVLIDGIMLPKNENIYITLMPQGAVVTTEKNSYYSRPKVKEIPAHHGRLIDADALKAWFVEWYDLNADLEIIHFLEILSEEDSAPTIIEAEE